MAESEAELSEIVTYAGLSWIRDAKVRGAPKTRIQPYADSRLGVAFTLDRNKLLA